MATKEKKEVVEAGEKCRIDRCKRPYRAKGYCNVHYKAWRHGELPHSRKGKGIKPTEVPAAEGAAKPETAGQAPSA